LDAFVLARLEAEGLAPGPEADRRTLIRRATFDLLGLPPTPAEVEAFLDDSAPDAYEKLIDRLLASPHYGERWARHWLDVVRFGESHGYETNVLRFNAWPYRDYVIRALNRDTPFAQFVREQLAGDTVPDADWLTQSATGFLVGGVHDVVEDKTVEGTLQRRMDDLDDMITATASAFLGLTVNCARCHDHKFDPITQRDYYALQAVLAGVRHEERDVPAPDAERRKEELARVRAELSDLEQRLDGLERFAQSGGPPKRLAVNSRRNVDRFQPVEARFVRFTVRATNNLEPCIDELEVFAAEGGRNVALASAGTRATASSVLPNSPIHRLEHINDGHYGNSRSWISNEPGKGWVQLEFPSPVRIDRVVWGRDREERFRDRLPVDYTLEVALEPGHWTLVASSADRQPFGKEPPVPETNVDRDVLFKRVEALRARLPELTLSLKVYAGRFTQPERTHVLQRGDPTRRGEAVAPGGIAAVRPALTLPADAPEAERRRALAEWIGHPDNPLPPRVMVNRLWHYHFGQGLVRTPSDFGFQGDRPSHPELLEWLAGEFLRHGGRLKPIHRLIMTSATYRQSSALNEKALARDRDNRLLWRVAPRRLEAEPLRDAVLAVSGRLDLAMGGPSFNVWEKNTNYVVIFKPKPELGPPEFRRMIYMLRPRSQNDPTFGAFDCPDASLVMPRRNVSTTALQALNLLNGGFMVARAADFAARLGKEVGHDPAAQARRAFQLAFARDPTAAELAAAVALVREHGAASLCRAIFNANEFVYVN
jgi:hypothetical protein